MSIILPNGVLLEPIQSSPNNDYMAGTDGQVYSRTKYAGFGRKEYVAWYPLKGHRTKKGYVSVTMCHQGRKVTKNVHRLICEAFHGPPDKETLQVRHLDGSKDNNIPGNLAWGTQAENWLDRKAHGRGCEGEKHHCAKFTNSEREKIRWAITMGLCSQVHAARMLGVSQSAVGAIVRSQSA